MPTFDYHTPRASDVVPKRSAEESVALENLVLTIFVFGLLLAPMGFMLWVRVAHD